MMDGSWEINQLIFSTCDESEVYMRLVSAILASICTGGAIYAVMIDYPLGAGFLAGSAVGNFLALARDFAVELIERTGPK